MAVTSAHAWCDSGKGRDLRDLWPEPPAALVWGMELYRGALNAVMLHDAERDREERPKGEFTDWVRGGEPVGKRGPDGMPRIPSASQARRR